MVSSTLKHTQKLIFDDTDNQHNKDVCPFIAYCVNEFKTVFHGLIFWRFLFLPIKKIK